MGLMQSWDVSHGEQDASYYDAVYKSSDEYALHYTRSRYYFLWTVIVDRMQRTGVRSVLEVGCGSGQFAHFLHEQGFTDYLGIDFSRTAITKARRRVPAFQFEVDDARTSDVYDGRRWDCIVCTEVLEHLNDDLGVVSRFPELAYCICSVPDFPYVSHVRHFTDEEPVRERYRAFFDSFHVATFRRPDAESGRYFLFDGHRNGVRVTEPTVPQPAV